MRRPKRLLMALLLSTALVSPQRASADPVTAFIGGALNALGAGTWLASAAQIGAWTAGFGLGEFLSTTLVGQALL